MGEVLDYPLTLIRGGASLTPQGDQMPYHKRKHHRCSIRLPGHDYTSPGACFVTICVRDGECLLGEAVGGGMRLSEWGQGSAATGNGSRIT